jgi:uncharacterized protein YecT (DUF1311 family)
MRRLTLAAALLLAAPRALTAGLAETGPRPSELACDTTKIGGRELAECLRTGVDHAESELRATVEAALKSIDARQGLMSSQKARWRRSLGEAQASWAAWRDAECQDVAPFEAGVEAKGADPRLGCIIDYDAARMASLKARYP